MKAKIQKVEMFNIEINGVTHEGFTKTETWKGMACYKNKDGEIVGSNFGGRAPFDWIFHQIDVDKKDEPEEFIIISASPHFLGKIKCDN